MIEREAIGLLGFLALIVLLTLRMPVGLAMVTVGIGGDFAYPLAAAAIITIGGVIAATATVRSRGNPWSAAVFVWALVAIYYRGGQEAQSVAYACVGAGAVVALGAFVGLAKTENRRHWLGV